MRVLTGILVLMACTAHAVTSDRPQTFEWPQGQYSQGVPTPAAVLGYELGEKIASPLEIQTYLQALHAAAPQRTQLVEYARSWEGRPLHFLVIGSPSQLETLDDIKANAARLANPAALSKAGLDNLLVSQPAVVWLGYGVHGNEISSPDAALATAYYLLAHPAAQSLFDDVLVVIDPLQNPDGRNRFVQNYRSIAGIAPHGSRIAAERNEPWPRGRSNHYLFDLNRDWFALTQPEVRGRVAAFLEFFPQVYVDLHEMGTDSTYYFPPAAIPYNPQLDAQALESQTRLGRAIASAFDSQGFRYFNRENYDLYYPGYGDTWPSLNGAAGMTFEMASARGLLATRADGSQLTFADGIQRHFVAGVATVEGAAAIRKDLLAGFVAARSGSDQGDFVITRSGDVGVVEAVVERLVFQGVKVRQVQQATRICGAQQPAGSFVISGKQPSGRLVETLLATDTPLSEAFWQEQERRAQKGLELEIYDTVAWSLQHLANLNVSRCAISAGVGEPVSAIVKATTTPAPASVAYLVPWGHQSAAKFLAGALLQNLVVEAGDRPLTINGRVFPAGSLMLRVAANSPELHETVRALAATTSAEVVSLNSTWLDAGMSFGSNAVKRFHAPQVAVAWGNPVRSTSAGSTRYVLEQKLGYPATPVWTSDLDSAYLDEFDVLILPDGYDYDGELSKSVKDNIDRWVRQGGTLIALAGAVDLLTQEALALLDVKKERLAGGGKSPSKKEKKASSAEGTLLEAGPSLDEALAPYEPEPPEVLGVMLNAVVNAEHWLANGLAEQLRFLVSGSDIYTPLRKDKGVNVVQFAGAENIKAAGYLWEASRKQLAHKPAVMATTAGRGVVIGFVADPTFRGYMDGLDVVIANAVFSGPAQSRKVRRPN